MLLARAKPSLGHINSSYTSGLRGCAVVVFILAYNWILHLRVVLFEVVDENPLRGMAMVANTTAGALSSALFCPLELVQTRYICATTVLDGMS
jgi:hypothetical protein